MTAPGSLISVSGMRVDHDSALCSASSSEIQEHLPSQDLEGPEMVELSRIVRRPIADLRLHPSLQRNSFLEFLCSTQLPASQSRGGIKKPLLITKGGVILDGYGEWFIAVNRGTESLLCVEYELDDKDALMWILRNLSKRQHLSDFRRIELGLELREHFQNLGEQNQRLGGQKKGSATLPEASRVDWRKRIAALTNCSEGNVGKVFRLKMHAKPEMLEALRSGEITINRAECWIKHPDHQLEELRAFRRVRGVGAKVGALLGRKKSSQTRADLDITRICSAIQAQTPSFKKEIVVREMQVPGRFAVFSRELLQSLENQGELPL